MVGLLSVLMVPSMVMLLPITRFELGLPISKMPSETCDVLVVVTLTLYKVPDRTTEPLALEIKLGLSRPMSRADMPVAVNPAPSKLALMLMVVVAEVPVTSMVDFLMAKAALWVFDSTVEIKVPVRFPVAV